MVSACALQVRDLACTYRDGTVALDGVDLDIAAGQAVAVVGANGAGKSTLLQHLNGLLAAQRGQVLVGGTPVSPATLAAVRQRVGYVFQDADDQLFMPSVQDDVAFGPVNQGLDAATVRQRVQDALQALGVLHLAPRAPWRLSGGEKRAVAIAGVLAMAPDALVFDEPSAGLDPAARRRLIDWLRGCALTRVIATHDLDLARDVCTRVVVLHQGRVAADGAPADVFADAALLQRCNLEPPLGGLTPRH